MSIVARLLGFLATPPTRGTCLRADFAHATDPETGLPYGWIFADDADRTAAVERQRRNPMRDAIARQLAIELERLLPEPPRGPVASFCDRPADRG